MAKIDNPRGSLNHKPEPDCFQLISQGELESLSENQQLVIRLKFEQGMSYQEISEQTGLTSSNVGFLLHNGLKKLREILPKDLLN